MNSIKKISAWIIHVLEFYLPLTTFVMMFLTFILAIFYRYFGEAPLVWTQELVTFCFVWTALLGAAYAFSTDSHVWFTLYYESLGKVGKRRVRIFNNFFMLFVFSVLLVPSFSFVTFMGYRESTSFPFSYDLTYAPFVLMIVLVLIRILVFLHRDISEIVSERKS